uniref:Putative secreted protein n=1 Tax=Panstrongylus lignarius TaxID=156445 RepID=A0A224XM48_9HEMI
MRFFNILFVLIFNIFYIQLINGARINRSLADSYTNKKLDDLEDVIKKKATKFLSNLKSSAKCNETALICKLCVSFRLPKKLKFCLIGQLRPEKLDALVKLNYDSYNIWKQEIQFNSMCTELPKPLNEVTICLEAYNISLSAFPRETAICLRAEITHIFHILSIDFHCIKFEKEKGLFFDSGIESTSKALIDINVQEGESIVSFNNPISWLPWLMNTWKMVKPFVRDVQTKRKPLKLESTKKSVKGKKMQKTKESVNKDKRQ